ncbi:MAG: phosphate/phosphite/phosphonate ABC transporter substrate-binding protein [Silicimonas sp.]|nr:phosphate/phosphite/phosphonate ABC transporter substrate-binding protein [Silicimonas sp.]
MIATLPMYDRPEAREITDNFWALIRENLAGAPETLSRDGFHWLDPDLLLSQTCSLPFRTGLQDDVSIVATPVHKLDCPAGTYFTAIIARADDPRQAFDDFADARLAVNSPVSQSGWAAVDDVARINGVNFSSLLLTGSHQASARAVAGGEADLCGLDAVSWSMIRRWDDFADDLRVLLHSPPTPSLPYITAYGNDPQPLQDALVQAVHALSDEERDILSLIDITYVPAEEYTALPIPPAPQFQNVAG